MGLCAFVNEGSKFVLIDDSVMTKRLLLAHSSPAWELKEFSGDGNS